MHDIHWATIFVVGGIWVLIIVLAAAQLVAMRAKGKPKRLGYGDQVSVEMKNGIVLTGYVRSATSNGPGVTILCSKDPA